MIRGNSFLVIEVLNATLITPTFNRGGGSFAEVFALAVSNSLLILDLNDQARIHLSQIASVLSPLSPRFLL